MKIYVSPKDFLSKFRLAASVAANLDVVPILQNVKVTADETHGTILQATDNEIAIRLGVDCEVVKNGEALLPPKRLSQILDLTGEEMLTLERTNGGLLIDGEVETYTLNTFPPDEFPDVEDFGETAYHEIPAMVFREMIRRTIFATDAENLKFSLGGVCFSLNGDDVSVVATDGIRLAWQQGCGCSVNEHTVETAIVSVRTLQILDRILGDKSINDDDEVRMAVDVTVVGKRLTSGKVRFQCKDVTLVSRLIEGKYPNWRGIIPKTKDETPAKIKCGVLLPAVLKAQVATSEDYSGVEFSFDKGRLTVQGQGRETGIAKIELPLTFEGENKRVVLSAKFMIGFLRVLRPDMKLSMFVPPDNEPVKITADNDGYTYVIMPMNPA
jgi:DNA polymerase-3 subunit beta